MKKIYAELVFALIFFSWMYRGLLADAEPWLVLILAPFLNVILFLTGLFLFEVAKYARLEKGELKFDEGSIIHWLYQRRLLSEAKSFCSLYLLTLFWGGVLMALAIAALILKDVLLGASLGQIVLWLYVGVVGLAWFFLCLASLFYIMADEFTFEGRTEAQIKKKKMYGWLMLPYVLGAAPFLIAIQSGDSVVQTTKFLGFILLFLAAALVLLIAPAGWAIGKFEGWFVKTELYALFKSLKSRSCPMLKT